MSDDTEKKADLKVVEEEVKPDVPVEEAPVGINTNELIGASMVVLAIEPDEVEVLDTEKSTKASRVTKMVPVYNYVMGFKKDDLVFPMYTFQKGIDSNIINFTNL